MRSNNFGLKHVFKLDSINALSHCFLGFVRAFTNFRLFLRDSEEIRNRPTVARLQKFKTIEFKKQEITPRPFKIIFKQSSKRSKLQSFIFDNLAPKSNFKFFANIFSIAKSFLVCILHHLI